MKRAFAIVFALCALPLRVAADDLTPKQIYLRALATMHALPEKPFLQFDYDWWQTTNDTARSTRQWTITLQTSSGMAHMVTETDGKTATVEEPFAMRPDVLLAHPTPSTTADAQAFQLGVDVDASEKLPTIAVVTARVIRYDVTLLGVSTAPGCARAYRLGLVPLSNPDRNNLRELWVDASSFRVCEAVAIWKAGIADGHIFPVTFTLYFDLNGLVSTWESAGSVGPQGSQAHYIASGAFDRLKQLDDSPIAGWPPP